jgi:hypothetical protein
VIQEIDDCMLVQSVTLGAGARHVHQVRGGTKLGVREDRGAGDAAVGCDQVQCGVELRAEVFADSDKVAVRECAAGQSPTRFVTDGGAGNALRVVVGARDVEI